MKYEKPKLIKLSDSSHNIAYGQGQCGGGSGASGKCNIGGNAHGGCTSGGAL